MADTTRQNTQQRQMTPEDHKELIKRTYWDYLCAFRFFKNELELVNNYKYIGEAPQGLLKALNYFRDFQFDILTQDSIAKEKKGGYVKSPATIKWINDMMKDGFKTLMVEPIYGDPNIDRGPLCARCDLGIAFPNNSPINGKLLVFDSNFVCRYVGEKPITPRDLSNDSIIGRGLQVITLLQNTIPEEELRQMNHRSFSEALVECCAAKWGETYFHKAIQYVDYTLCPLVERIRKYYRRVLESDIFAPTKDPKTLSSGEEVLRRIAEIRDNYLAHGIHYPIPQTFSYHYTNGRMMIDSAPDTLNRTEMHEVMEKAVMDILNYDTLNYAEFKDYTEGKKTIRPEKLKYKSPEDLRSDLANHFPNLLIKQTDNGSAVFPLVDYIASVVNLEVTTRFGFRVLIEDSSKLLEIAGTENPTEISKDRKIRGLALHDHFPFEEFYGEEMMQDSNADTMCDDSILSEKTKRVDEDRRSLIKARIEAENTDLTRQGVENLKQQKNALSEQAREAAREKKRRGGR